MADARMSNLIDGNQTVIKKWESVNLFMAAIALAADSLGTYAGDLVGLKGGGLRLLTLGALLLLVFDYRIAKRLVTVFRMRNSTSSDIGWLKLNVVAVVAVGVINCINILDNILSIGLDSFIGIVSAICTLVFFCTQIFVIVKLFKIEQSKLGISIIAFLLLDIILALVFDEGNASGAMLWIAIGLNVILGVRMYYQYNAFFGKATEGWDVLDNIF